MHAIYFFLDFSFNKIILAGDSAGGNLAIAITARAIQIGIPPPDGLFLAYPGREKTIYYSNNIYLNFFSTKTHSSEFGY